MQPTLRAFDLRRALTGVTLPFESAVFEAGRTLKTHIDKGVEYVKPKLLKKYHE